MANFRLPIESFEGGLAPGYFESDFPSFGNLNMAGKAEAVDLTDPSLLAQGLGRAELSGAVSDEIRILDEPVEANKTYGVGGDTVYEITDTSVSAIHTVSGATFEDIAYYQGNIYASYNTASDGRVARLVGSTWTDAWQTGLNHEVPHRLLVGGLDFLYVANGNKVASYDGVNDLFTADDLTLPEDNIIVSFQFTRNHLQILTNRPALTAGARSSIFLWDTNSPSWEVEYTFRERVTNNFMLNGTPFVHYEDLGKARLGFLDGSDIRPIASFGGSSPFWYQVTANKGFVAWIDGDEVLVWGAPESYLEPLMFPIMKGDSNFGTVASPFGFLMVGSSNKLERSSGYETGGHWKSMLVPINGNDKTGELTWLRVSFDALPADKSFIVKLVNSSGVEKLSETVTGEGKTQYQKLISISSEDIRIEFHFDNNPNDTVKIRSALIRGHTKK